MSRRHRELRALLIVGIVLLGSGAALVYWRGQHQTAAIEARDPPSIERDVLYWHDPMVPNARFDKPGKSPFMDMQLVPVYADGGEAGTVRVDANVAQNLGIRIGKVERIRLQPRLTAVGSVAFDDRLLQVVSARVDGVVLQLHVRTPLEPVRRGQPLATVLVPGWSGAQQEYLALLDARSDAARSLLTAARERLRLLGVPDVTVRRIESDRKVEATTTITSPTDGVVSDLGVGEGSAFAAGAALFRINGLASVWVNARIPEAQVSHVQVGAAATATAAAWPGEILTGKVVALLPQVDAATRTMTARIAFDNRSGRLAPGMFVSATLAFPGGGEVLAVPSEAVITTGTRTVVVRVNADRTFGVANVRPGAEQDDQTVILEGLAEGESVVVSGQFLIDSEASLKSALARLEPLPTLEEAAISGSAATHRTEGNILAMDGSSVTLDHEPVTSLKWPAMSMRFEAPLGGLPSGLAAGDRVAVSFEQTPAGYRIVSIDKVAGRARPDSRP